MRSVNNMMRYSKYGVLLSILLVLSILTIFSISEVHAAENISVSASSFENTIIIEVENGEKNTSDIKTVKIWVGTDNSFQSFKSEPGWGGGKYSNGQLLIFTAATTLKTDESAKFGVITDKKTSGINWKVLDENENTLGSGKTSIQEVSQISEISGEDDKMIEEIKKTGENLYGTKKFIPDKLSPGSNIRLVGNGFDSSQTLTFYLDNILIKSSKTDDGGNFVTTLSIPDTINPGTSEFIIKNEFGNLQTTNISISEEKNRLLRESSNFELTSIPIEIKLDETLSFSGNAKPLTTIILTIKNEEGQTEKTRVVNVNANGKWEYEELITSKEILGTKTFMLKNGQNHLLRDIIFKSDKLLNISSSATRYNQGDTIIFTGSAIPNKDATVIIKDPNGKIIHFDLIEIDASGNIEYEFVTDDTFGNGTYVLITTQETESDAYLFGIGQYPTTQIVVLTDKTNYIGTGSSNAFINVVGPPTTPLLLTIIDPSDNIKFTDTITTNAAGKNRHELNIVGYSTGVYKAVVSKANIQDSVKFAIGVQPGSGDITLTPPKQSYLPGEQLIISGQTEQDNSILTLSLIDPSGNTVSKIEIFSDSSGSFSTNMLGIPITAEIGNWKLSVISKLDTAENTINVVETSGIELALNIEKTQYQIGDVITIKGSAPITKTTVYIDILDVGGTSIASLETPITNSGLFSLPWTIPSDINFGAYTIEITDAANTDSIEIYIQ